MLIKTVDKLKSYYVTHHIKNKFISNYNCVWTD